MQRNVVLNDQKLIFQNLLEETLREYAFIHGKNRGDIIIGAHETVFSFRNAGRGVLAGEIARAVLPVEDGIQPTEKISKRYDLEQYLSADVFVLHSFHEKECAILHLEMGERKLFSVYPDESAPEGILVHIEWKAALEPECILTEKDVFHAMLKAFPLNSGRARLKWEPEVWFNSKRIRY